MLDVRRCLVVTWKPSERWQMLGLGCSYAPRCSLIPESPRLTQGDLNSHKSLIEMVGRRKWHVIKENKTKAKTKSNSSNKKTLFPLGVSAAFEDI